MLLQSRLLPSPTQMTAPQQPVPRMAEGLQNAGGNVRFSSEDVFAPRFSGNMPSAERVLGMAGIEEYSVQPEERNMVAGRALASGANGRLSPSKEKAEHFFNLIVDKLEGDYAFLHAREIAHFYLKGFYKIEPSKPRALEILNRIIEKSADREKGEYDQIGAAMDKIEHCGELLSPEDKTATLQLIETLSKTKNVHMFMLQTVARFFGRVMNNPDKAREYALLADQLHTAWNKEHDAENPDGSCRGSLGARELMEMVEDFTRGEKGMPKDIAFATTLLDSLVNKVRTPNPILMMQAVGLYVRELENPARAEQWAEWMLANAQYIPELEIAELMAKELKKTERAEAILNHFKETHPETTEDTSYDAKKMYPMAKIQMAKIYAAYLNQPDKALALVDDFNLSELDKSQRTNHAIALAELYGKHLGMKTLAKKYLQAGKPFAENGGGGDSQITRLALAEAYLDILNDTSSCVNVLKDVLAYAPRQISPDVRLKDAFKLLDRCNQQHPDIPEIRLQMDILIRQATKKHDTFYSSDDAD